MMRGVLRSDIVLLMLLVTLVGCGPRAELRLDQPHPPPAQRALHLSSGWAATTAAGGRRECVLDFPLPGSQAGPRDFRMYISMPAGEGSFSVGAGEQSVRGFLVQVKGELAGKSEFSGGAVRLRRVPLNPGVSKLEVDVFCRDGTRIAGSARLREDRAEVRTFRLRYEADVRLLEAGAQPRDDSPATPTMDQSTPP